MPNELFLSHTSANRPFVDDLAEALRLHGIPIWYSDTNIVGAQMWHDEIGKALARRDWFILVLSPDAVLSKWVKRELISSLQEDRLEGRIIPLLYQQCAYDELSWTLSQLQMVDFSQDFHDGCRNLLRIWNIDYSPTD